MVSGMAEGSRLFGEPTAEKLISENDVLRLRPSLAKAHLRVARKKEIIRWTRGKRGSAWYRLSDVDAFIETHMEIQCRNPASVLSLNTEGNGLPRTQAVGCFTASGLNPELDELVARALARQI